MKTRWSLYRYETTTYINCFLNKFPLLKLVEAEYGGKLKMLPTIKIKTIKANVLFAILNMRLNVIGSNCLREQLDFDSWMDIP